MTTAWRAAVNHDFYYFSSRSASLGLENLRNIDLNLSEIERFAYNAHLIIGVGEWGIGKLEGLPRLKNLTSRLNKDIMSGDYELLKDIRNASDGRCHPTIDVR
ncbi:MAG: hypothetical protein Q9177_002485 [Variospora cf. flavescens]